MRRWVSEQDAISGWLAEQAARAEAERDVPMCMHCYQDIDPSEAFDAIGEVFCSLRCAMAVAAFGHAENCQDGSCADGAALTLPPQLCAFCETAVASGDTAHPSCREKVRRALELQDAAVGKFAS